MEKFTFTRNADGSLGATPATKAAVAAAFRANPGTLSREVVAAAAADLVREANKLAFDSGREYEDCSRFLMSRDPWLALATCAIDDDARSARALGIEIVGGATA